MDYSKTYKYKLNPAVFYRVYTECVIVYNTQMQKVYHFNESAGDIISCFEKYIGVDEVADNLLDKYDVEDEKEFKNSIYDFVVELEEKNLIHKQYKQIETKNNLERQLSSYFREGLQLYSACIESTYNCNEKCRHCYISRQEKKELTTEQIKDILDQLADMRVLEITFTGGEFFTRKDAFDLLDYAYQKHFLVDIFTNGILLGGDEILRIKATYPRCVHFSVYSYKADKHDTVTRVAGSFEKTIKAIQSCVLVGIPVNIKTPVFMETVDDIDGMVELANSLGVSIELGKNITPKKDGDLSPVIMKIRDRSHVQVFFEKMKNVKELVDVSHQDSVQSDRICGAGQRSISINPYGEVYPCNMLSLCIGDVTKDTIRNIWEKSEQLRWWRDNNRKSKKEGCDDCDMVEQCFFCPGESMMRSGNPLLRYEEACNDTSYALEKEIISTEGRRPDAINMDM